MSPTELLSMAMLSLHIIVGFAAAVYISLHKRPETAIAWIFALIFLPVLGVIAFLFFGIGKLPTSRREKQREVSDLIAQRSHIDGLRSLDGDPTWLDTALVLNEHLGSLPMVGGNGATLIPGYEDSIHEMAAAIDTAENFVHVEFYILVLDDSTRPFFDALARATARGVTVRVLSDFVAHYQFPNRKETSDAFSNMGAEFHLMLPLRPHRGQWQRPDLRNHRKIVVIDDRIGFMGSQNLIESSYLKPKNVNNGLHWKELVARFEGPVVGELAAVFVTDWYSETEELLPVSLPALSRKFVPEDSDILDVDAQVVPSGPSFDNQNNLKLFVLLIHNAHHRVSITSPYFVPDESTMMALVTAASRGVVVELFVSEVADQFLVYHAQRSYYDELLSAGVRIYLYRSPTVLHSKHFSIDDDVAVIGSSNMDIRSFSLNMEVSTLVRSHGFNASMRKVEDSYRTNSFPLDGEEWKKRPLHQKVFDGLARLTSSLQ